MNPSSTIARMLAVAGAALVAALIAAVPASAAAKDRNHDKIPDRWESKHGLSLNVNQARKDQDSDGLRNRGEFEARMDPRDDDTDGDGVEDGDEGAGTVTSFDAATGELVINVFSGDTITGTVDADTEIECSNDDATEPDDHGDDVGDDHGDDVGDDHGDDGPGHDVGDDHGDDSTDDESGDDGHGGPGSDRREHDGHGPSGEDCSVDALVPGAIVREAELDLTATGLVYEEIELQ